MTVSNATSPTVENDIIPVNRRTEAERREVVSEAADTGAGENQNRKAQRRRHIDPTTCERDYSGQEIEFMRAMDNYKQQSGRMFPTCSEVLEVIRALGYVQLSEQQQEEFGLLDDFCDSDDFEFDAHEDADELAEV